MRVFVILGSKIGTYIVFAEYIVCMLRMRSMSYSHFFDYSPKECHFNQEVIIPAIDTRSRAM